MKANLKNSLSALLLLALVISISACDSEETTVDNNISLNIRAMVGEEVLADGESYTNTLGQTYQLDLDACHIYLSNISLVKADGTEQLLEDVVLFDFQSTNIITNISEGDYTGFKVGVGLDEILNESDPNVFDPGHPLSYANNTHWSWAAKYKFVMLEGKSGTDLSSTFAYHLGADALYRAIDISQSTSISNTETTILTLNIDFDKVFENIDFTEEKLTHTNDNMPLAEKVMNNFSGALSVE